MKVSDVFYSIQGEGYYSGKAAIFIRFYGCNLSCTFCDEPLHTTSFTNYTISSLLSKIKQYPSNHIVLTGGEPSLYDRNDLILALREQNKYITIETNGFYPKNINQAHWITYSPKNLSQVDMQYGNEIKLLVDESFNEQLIPSILKVRCENLFLQPKADKNNIIEANVIKCYNLIKKYPQLRLSLQIHKYIHIP